MDTTKDLRKKLLVQFDEYVRNEIGDDDITCDVWLSEGLPDGYNEDDLNEIAEDDELWLDCVKAFGKCCRLGGRM